MARVTKIEATKDFLTHSPIQSVKKRKVCGYARVSTKSEEQATSYDAQIDYYTNYIKSRPDWEFVDVYADEGITGTSIKKRSGFKDMIEDALSGKIDLIITKSISRFARNTVDSLTTIRNLKDYGVEVFFEKENLWSFDSKCEVMFTIMASIAQEESRSISENVTWGHRKRFEDGKYSVAYKRFLGYDRGKDGGLVVNKEQAKIVKLIYQRFLEGCTAGQIAKELMSNGIKTPSGKDRWQATTVLSILTNEKYKGAALLQKTYTVSFLTKESRKNTGELPKYYIEDGHEAIINPADWDVVQEEIAARKKVGSSVSSQSFLSCKLICEDCGSYYGAKVWHSTDKYRRVIYRCNNKYKGEAKCGTPHITEEELKEKFLKAYNTYMGSRDRILGDAKLMCEALSDTTELEEKLEHYNMQLTETGKLYQLLISQNASSTGTSDFQDQERTLFEKYQKQSETVSELSNKLTAIRNRRHKLQSYITSMAEKPLVLSEWKNYIWVSMIDHCLVRKDRTITFVFRDGTEITY